LTRNDGTALGKATALKDLLAQIATAGIKLPPGNRIAVSLDVILDFLKAETGLDGMRGRSLVRVMTAVGETEEFATILDLLMPLFKEGNAWGKRLRQALSGRLSGMREHDAARAAQFELFAAARCQAAGAVPVLAEPDLVLQVGTKRLAIAAKRVLSLGRLEENVRKARRQIAAAGIDGIIALDLTVALGFDSSIRLLADLSDMPTVPARGAIADREGFAARQRMGVGRSDGARVRLVASYARCLVVDRTHQSMATLHYWIAGPVPPLAYIAAPLKRFVTRLMVP